MLFELRIWFFLDKNFFLIFFLWDVLWDVLWDFQLWVGLPFPIVPIDAHTVWTLLLDSPDFFSVWQCQRHSVSVKIFVNTCNNNNYCIFFLKTVSHNVRWIQTMSDLFSLKVLGEMLGEFWKCWGNGFDLKKYYF